MLNKHIPMNRPLPHRIFSKRNYLFRGLERVILLSRGKFGDIYDNFAPRIYNYIYFRTTDPQLAEDLTSQVFLKALENREVFKRTGAPMINWLYAIAHNLVIDAYRRSRDNLGLEDVAVFGSGSPTPAEECEYHFEKDVLRNAVERLTPDQKQVLILKFIDGMTTEEVGVQIGKRVGTVRALQMRALRSLNKLLEENNVTDSFDDSREAAPVKEESVTLKSCGDYS